MEQNLMNIASGNLTLPHDVVQLPSGGIFYKNKKKSLRLGYLTANDENFLVSAASSGNINIILQLLRNKIYEPDMKPDDLLEGDVEAILIFLRNTSFGPEYTITLNDPKTDKPFQVTVVLDELNIKKPSVQPDENGHYTTKLPKSGSTVKLKPLTYTEQLELEKMADNYPSNMIPPKITWRLNKQIIEIDGNPDKTNIVKFVESLPIMDSKHIRNFLKDNTPSLDLKRQATTPSGEMVNFDITFGVEFFRPFF
jgi:hypothetical protein